jgi:carbonic anhydrase
MKSVKMGLCAAAAMLALTPALAQEKDWRFGDGVMPERWSLENPNYALCDAGTLQSPIDLAHHNADGNIQVSTNYGGTNSTLALGDQKLQLDFPQGMAMMSGGKRFNLIQVHFHTPAEHAIDGMRHPLVAHFVHATDDGELGVLGVMFEEGAPNSELQKIANALRSGDGTAVTVDAGEMVPDDLTVYRYMGSLTTPPCSEGVNWHVVQDTMTASPQQIAAMRQHLGDTARSLQPRGNRLVVAPPGN